MLPPDQEFGLNVSAPATLDGSTQITGIGASEFALAAIGLVLIIGGV